LFTTAPTMIERRAGRHPDDTGAQGERRADRRGIQTANRVIEHEAAHHADSRDRLADQPGPLYCGAVVVLDDDPAQPGAGRLPSEFEVILAARIQVRRTVYVHIDRAMQPLRQFHGGGCFQAARVSVGPVTCLCSALREAAPIFEAPRCGRLPESALVLPAEVVDMAKRSNDHRHVNRAAGNDRIEQESDRAFEVRVNQALCGLAVAALERIENRQMILVR